MKFAKHLILNFILIILCSPLAWSQLEELETDLAAHQQAIRDASNDADRFAASDEFRNLLLEAVVEKGAFDYPFERLTTMSVITSSDKKVRLFNWNVPREDQTHAYYCVILKRPSPKEEWTIFELTEDDSRREKIEYKYLDADDWIGALYYRIIPMDKKGKTYTLLGWDGNNRITNKKYIDALTFTGKKVRLGAPIFKSERGTAKRVVFEYAKESSMSLKYYEKQERIVFDHLSPQDPAMIGNYAFYGPDLSFDSYRLEKGKWIEEINIDVRMDRENRPYNDPRDR